jgi:predicted ATPase/DNA-binding CsgD family transcriptional regulator
VTDSGLDLRDLGLHRLKDLVRPERLYQVGEGDFPPLRSLDAYRQNLPHQRTSFVGREEEIRLVRKHLDRSRLVTLTGVGGCGKTRLALQVAAEELDAFADGISVVELAPVSEPELLPSAVAVVVGVPVGKSQGRTVRDEVLDVLSYKQLLLVLDNCEHLVDACAEFVGDVLDRCVDVKVLATSREVLGIRGEQAITVRSLDVSSDEGIEPSEAERLFYERAASARQGFEPTADNRADVIEICHRLDGMPLAIELAAARVAHLSPRQIASRLDERFELLTGGRGRVQRQQTLTAVLDWSYDLLSDVERVLLRRLSVFSGSFTLEAVEAVCGEGLQLPAVNVLASLVAKSMVAIEDEPEARYRLLETVRLYAQDKLVAAGESAQVRDRHRDYFLEWVESRPDDDLLRHDAAVVVEQHNLRAALTWSERQDRTDLIARMATPMWPLWDYVDGAEGTRWLSIGVSAVDQLSVEHAVGVLVARAWARAVTLDAVDAGDDWLVRAMEIGGDLPGFWPANGRAWHAVTRGNLGFRGRSVWDEVESDGRRALELASTPAARFTATCWLGHARVGSGNVAGAIDASERARALALELRLPDWAAYLASLMSRLYHLVGDNDGAVRFAEHALEELPTRTWGVHHSLALPLALAGREDHREAFELLRSTLTAERLSVSVPGTAVSALTVLGAVAALRGDWTSAAVVLGCARAGFDRGVARTPVDVALYLRYAFRALETLGDDGVRLGEQGASMSPEEGVVFGLSADVEPPPREHPLTERELEVARLVVSGLTNRQIAQRLVLSVRTVDAHIDHIRNKLSLRSRAQIAAWVTAEVR